MVFAALAVFSFGPDLLGSDDVVLSVAAGLAAVAALTVVVAMIFSSFQMRDTTPSDVAAGALVATGLQVVVTSAYVVYLELFADFQSKCGASQLAVVVLLGLWLLLSNAVLLVAYRYMLRRCARRAQGEVT